MTLGRNGFSGASIDASSYSPPDVEQVDAKEQIADNALSAGYEATLYSGSGQAGSAPAGSGIPMEGDDSMSGDAGIPLPKNLNRNATAMQGWRG